MTRPDILMHDRECVGDRKGMSERDARAPGKRVRQFFSRKMGGF